MKIVKIKKFYRNGSVEHDLILTEPLTDYLVDEKVSDWCESNSSGSNYGWRYEWSYLDDVSEIKKILLKNISDLDNKINNLSNTRDMYLGHLNLLEVLDINN